MNGVFLAERAIFIKLDSVRIVLLILIIVVISLLTFGASQGYSGSTSFCHIFRLLKKLTPLMRSANLFYYTLKTLSTVFYGFFDFYRVKLLFAAFKSFLPLFRPFPCGIIFGLFLRGSFGLLGNVLSAAV